jgi:hypothetical protein
MLVFHVVIILEGGDYMIFYRMYVPLLPVIFLLLGPATEVLLKLSGLENKPMEGTIVAVFHILLVIFISLPWWPFSESIADSADAYEHRLGKHYRTYKTFDRFTDDDIRLGKWLKQNAHPGTYLAVGLAGAIPYYSELKTIDVLGVTDAHIAHSKLKKDERPSSSVKPKKGGPKLMAPLAAHEKSDWHYIIRKEPDVIIVNTARYDLLSRAGYSEFRIPGLNRRYWAKTDLWPETPRKALP